PSLLKAHECFLAIVDVQPGFYRGRSDVDDSDFTSFVERVTWVAHLARALDVPCIVTAERPERNGPPAEPVLAAAGWPEVFDKRVFDLAAQDDIWRAVEALGRHTAVVIGLETDVCVAHSAIGLAGHGLRAAVVSDATF